MNQFKLRVGWISAAALLLGVLGCESTQMVQGPGALPRPSDSSLSPRLNAATYIAHGQLLERQGNFPQACAQYQKALELTPDSVAARNRLGVALNKLGRHAEATNEFRTALAHVPDAAYIQNNLGFSLYLERRFDEAREVLQHCADEHPTFLRARMNLALTYGQLARYEDSLAEFLLACNPVDAHYNVAMLQAEAGELRGATVLLEKALKMNPDFEPAREQLRVIARLAAEQESAAHRAIPATPATVEHPPVLVSFDVIEDDPRIKLSSFEESAIPAGSESSTGDGTVEPTPTLDNDATNLIDELVDAIIEDAPERDNLLEDARECLPDNSIPQWTDATH